MKKIVVSSVLAAGLIVSGGTGAYLAYAKENTPNPNVSVQNQGLNMGQMMKQMKTGNFEDMQEIMEKGNINLDQMKKHMKEIHPELTDKQLEDLFKKMHGAGGACNSDNAQGMMGNTL